jgi:hypothetical protein
VADFTDWAPYVVAYTTGAPPKPLYNWLDASKEI